ncbi:hypothetical protein DPX16_1878 [Anabarilius grahami]|uniref:Uncharacterized protein n=1 Tax=Anabarilius grahami TaxID=495550 RepID=A0A3N0YTA8_ANAGA|nr:hypothetical protein DPX16_1878 [Anabarilius grahami]
MSQVNVSPSNDEANFPEDPAPPPAGPSTIPPPPDTAPKPQARPTACPCSYTLAKTPSSALASTSETPTYLPGVFLSFSHPNDSTYWDVDSSRIEASAGKFRCTVLAKTEQSGTLPRRPTGRAKSNVRLAQLLLPLAQGLARLSRLAAATGLQRAWAAPQMPPPYDLVRLSLKRLRLLLRILELTFMLH